MGMPLVSVIIPCFNCEKYVRKAIESIQNQTYENLEIIVVNDASTDGTARILEDIAKRDSRIRYYCHEVNRKLIYTLNEMIDYATGEYIARMDSDDVADIERISTQVQYMLSNPKCSLCGTQARLIDEDDRVIGGKNVPVNHTDISRMLRYGNVIIHPSILAKKSVLKKCRFSFEYIHAEDFELWLRLVFEEKITVHNIDAIGLNYRISSNQISSLHSKEQVDSSCKALCKYGLVDKEYADLHSSIFMNYGQNRDFSRKDIEKYVKKEYKDLHSMDVGYAVGPMSELL